MPKFSPTLTRTYMATREHPQLGLLVKVGSSMNPKHRCTSLGAKQISRTLPHHAEGDLKQLLAPYQAWPPAHRRNWTHPVFTAPTEWFKATPAAGDIIRTYLDNLRAT